VICPKVMTVKTILCVLIAPERMMPWEFCFLEGQIYRLLILDVLYIVCEFCTDDACKRRVHIL